MEYGYFDDDRREYVVTQPDTPLPWINYLGTEDHFGMISNTAGGCSFYRDARLRRLTRYRHNGAPFDLGGRYLYLRDDADGDYWSPSWQPTRSVLDAYECRHGLSYTSISSERGSVRAEVLYFVPSGETLEVWRLRLGNDRDTRADLSLFSSVEFCLWDALDDLTNFQRNFSVGEVEVADGVIYHKSEYRERRNHFASSRAPSRWSVSTPSATSSSAPTGVGTRRSRWSVAVRSTRSRTVGHPWGHTTSGSRLLRESTATWSSSSATSRTPPTRSSTLSGLDHQQGRGSARDRALAGDRAGREGVRRPACLLGRAPVRPPRRDARR